MKTRSVLFTAVGLLALGASAALAANDNDTHTVTITVNEVAMIRVYPSGIDEVSFTVGAPTTAGDAFVVTPTNDAAKWLQYTSIVPTAATYKRKITVEKSSGTIPAFLTLTVTPAAPTGANGRGNRGTAGTQVTISGTAQDLVTGIGSCYTGIAASHGVQLTYALTVDSGEEGDLYASSYSPVIKYTLTEAAAP